MDSIARQDLISAKAKHYLFKSKMRAYLEGSTEVPEEILSDFNKCGVGIWINTVGKKKFSNNSALMELDIIHQRIHAVAKEIIDLKKQGLQNEAEAKMFDINAIGNQIIDKIDDLSLVIQD
ncbi:MAG: CZB domain-containing protein [Opitutaceae bacterium]|nr:CZB domain-containing protein [Cytophagales bacterium]